MASAVCTNFTDCSGYLSGKYDPQTCREPPKLHRSRDCCHRKFETRRGDDQEGEVLAAGSNKVAENESPFTRTLTCD